MKCLTKAVSGQMCVCLLAPRCLRNNAKIIHGDTFLPRTCKNVRIYKLGYLFLKYERNYTIFLKIIFACNRNSDKGQFHTITVFTNKGAMKAVNEQGVSSDRKWES